MFKNRCYNGGNRHKFTPRWTVETKPNAEFEIGRCSSEAMIKIIESMTHRKETYHGDVCEWCGKVVNNG